MHAETRFPQIHDICLDRLTSAQRLPYTPKDSQGRELIYFVGHSLGLQPKTVQHIVNRELNQWASSGVEGHFDPENAWYTYHERMRETIRKIEAKRMKWLPLTALLST